jgi:hypothetical protein
MCFCSKLVPMFIWQRCVSFHVAMAWNYSCSFSLVNSYSPRLLTCFYFAVINGDIQAHRRKFGMASLPLLSHSSREIAEWWRRARSSNAGVRLLSQRGWLCCFHSRSRKWLGELVKLKCFWLLLLYFDFAIWMSLVKMGLVENSLLEQIGWN